MDARLKAYEHVIIEGHPQVGQRLDERMTKIVKLLTCNRALGLKIERLLDVGCNDGSIAVLLKDVTGAAEVYGVDISKQAVECAAARGVRAIHLDVDKNDFPYSGGFFDLVFCGEVIEHIFDTDHFLTEIRRVLRPGGLCVISTPNLAAWYNRICLLLGFQPYHTGVSLRHNVGKLVRLGENEGGLHIRVFTLNALKELLRINGFHVSAVFGANETVIIEGENVRLLPLALRLIMKPFSLFPSLSLKLIAVGVKTLPPS